MPGRNYNTLATIAAEQQGADLREAERRLLAGEPLEGLLATAAANGASRRV
jgi:hypothetical protein